MKIITVDAALASIKIGLDTASRLGEPSSVSVVDDGGNLIGFARSDGAAFGVSDIAINKAYTSAAFQCRTDELYSDSQPGGEIYGFETSGGGRPFVIFGGGIPLIQDGICIGAVGVSGGPVASDVEIAIAMVDYLKTLFD